MIVGVAAVGGTLIALAQFMEFEDEWKFGASGFLLGSMLVAIIAILVFHGQGRQIRLERDRKINEQLQLLPSRRERVEELQREAEQLDLEVSNMKIDVANQEKSLKGFLNTAPDWIQPASDAVTQKKRNEVFMREQAFERVIREQARVSELTDDQWHAEQSAKIYIPE